MFQRFLTYCNHQVIADAILVRHRNVVRNH